MARYIDAELLEQWMKRDEWGTPDERWRPESEFGRMIDTIPTADVEEVKHGEWKEIQFATSWYSVVSMKCSKCGKYHNEVFTYGNPTENINYCPNCGAKMDGKKGN